MIDTSQWPEVLLDVLKGVNLDPKNVRLEIADAKVEADIIEDLFVNEDALGLVESICTVGYLTHEIPVVLKRDGKYVMLEGNRRLAALKAIQNPMLVPDYQSRISALTTVLPDRSALSKIRVMVAPSQTDADQLIAAIHTGNLRKPWTPDRQAAFFQAQIDAGRKLPELLNRYPTIDVRRFVFRARIINLFKSIKYEDAELRDFLTSKKWARGLSTLARIYESKEFLEITGLMLRDDGGISKRVSDDVFDDIATAIVRGMYEENINTRSLNSVKSPRFRQLMSELRQIVANANEPDQPSEATAAGKSDGGETSQASTDGLGNSGNAADETSSDSGDSTGTNSGPAPNSRTSSTTNAPPRRKKKPTNLDLGQIRPPDSYPEALKILLGELSEINVQKFPNGTFLMIRAALEKSIKSFAEAKSIDIKATRHSRNGWVQLGNALAWLLDYVNTNGPTYLKQVIKGLQTGELVTYTNSSDALNATNHNHHFKVDPDQAFAMWGSIDSVMRYLMNP